MEVLPQSLGPPFGTQSVIRSGGGGDGGFGGGDGGETAGHGFLGAVFW